MSQKKTPAAPQKPQSDVERLCSMYSNLSASVISPVVREYGPTMAQKILENLSEDPETKTVKAIMEAFPGVPEKTIREELRKHKGNTDETIMALVSTSASFPPPLKPVVKQPQGPAAASNPKQPTSTAPVAIAGAKLTGSSSGKSPVGSPASSSPVAASPTKSMNAKDRRKLLRQQQQKEQEEKALPQQQETMREYKEMHRDTGLAEKQKELTKEIKVVQAVLDEVPPDVTDDKHKDEVKKLAALSEQLEETRRLLAEAEVQRALAEATAAQAAKNSLASVTLSPVAEDPNSLDVVWKLQGVTPTTKDWIGLFIHNREFKYTTYVYTNGSAEGKHRFSNLGFGFYDARIFHSGSQMHLCRSEPICLGPEVKVQAKISPADRMIVVTWDKSKATTGDWVGLYTKTKRSNKQYIAYTPTTGDSVAFPIPREPGVYEARYFLGASGYCFSGKSDPIDVLNGDRLIIDGVVLETSDAPAMVKVHWSCQSKEPNPSHDWIGVFEKNASNRSYIACKYTSQGKIDDAKHPDSGSLDIELSGKARQSMKQGGEYEVRFFNHAVGKYTSLLTAAFTFP